MHTKKLVASAVPKGNGSYVFTLEKDMTKKMTKHTALVRLHLYGMNLSYLIMLNQRHQPRRI